MSSLSVVIPVYNQEKYIGACLNSVSKQSFINYEVVCIDDGSTDNSAEIIQSHMRKNGKIRYEYQENKGAGLARNRGLELATGDYVAFLDPDDALPDDDVYRDLIRKGDETGALIVGGSMLVLIGDKLFWPRNSRYSFSAESWVDYGNFQDYAFYTRYIYKKSMLDEAGLKFPGYRRFQDPLFMIESMLTAGSFYSLTRPSYAYRIGHKPVAYSEKKIIDYLAGIESCLNLTSRARLEMAHRNLTKLFGNERYIARSLPDFCDGSSVFDSIDKVFSSIDWALLASDPKQTRLPLVEYRNSLGTGDFSNARKLGLRFAIERACSALLQRFRFLNYRRYTR